MFPDRISTVDGNRPPDNRRRIHGLRRAMPDQPKRSDCWRGGRRGPRARLPLLRAARGRQARRRAPSLPPSSGTERASRGAPSRPLPRRPVGDKIRIDEVREFRRDLHMRPYEADRRVYLMPARTLNEDAADALLKDLEEPPPYAVIVLVANELGPLPPTIRSRCQLVPFAAFRACVRPELAARAPGLPENEARPRAPRGRPARSGRAPARPGSARDGVRSCARCSLRYADPEFEPGEAAQLCSSRARAAARRSRPRRRSSRARADGSRSRAARAPGARGAEREELLAGLEELASWYRDLVVVAVGAEHAAIHADRLDVLSEDGTSVRLAGAERAGEHVARPGARSRSSTSTRLWLSKHYSSGCSARSAAPWPPRPTSVRGLRRLLPPLGPRLAR